MTHVETHAWPATCGRSAAAFAVLGGTVAGLVASWQWPVVGTFFGALGGAAAGAAFGVLDAAALLLLARLTTSLRWLRVLSGVLALLCCAVLTRGAAPSAVGIGAVAVLVVTAAASGPFVVHGVRLTGGIATRTLVHVVACVAAAAAVVGGVVGAALGAAHPSTVAVAVVEGGVLGAVSGAVLGCAAALLALVPRMRTRG